MSIATALRNYRVAAWVTGVGLLVLVFIAMPLKYFFGEPRPVALVGMTARVPVHGLHRVHADPGRALPLAAARRACVILLAGTIPIASFVAERQVTRRVREGRAVLGSG